MLCSTFNRHCPVMNRSLLVATAVLTCYLAATLGSETKTPLEIMTDVTNEFGVCVLQLLASPKVNTVFSPYGLVSVSLIVYEGATGTSAAQIHNTLHLPWHRDVTRLGFRDLHRYIRSYFTSDGFLRGLILSKSQIKFKPTYSKILRFYGFDSPSKTAITEPALVMNITTKPMPPATKPLPTTVTKPTIATTEAIVTTTSDTLTTEGSTQPLAETTETSAASTTVVAVTEPATDVATSGSPDVSAVTTESTAASVQVSETKTMIAGETLTTGMPTAQTDEETTENAEVKTTRMVSATTEGSENTTVEVSATSVSQTTVSLLTSALPDTTVVQPTTVTVSMEITTTRAPTTTETEPPTSAETTTVTETLPPSTAESTVVPVVIPPAETVTQRSTVVTEETTVANVLSTAVTESTSTTETSPTEATTASITGGSVTPEKMIMSPLVNTTTEMVFTTETIPVTEEIKVANESSTVTVSETTEPTERSTENTKTPAVFPVTDKETTESEETIPGDITFTYPPSTVMFNTITDSNLEITRTPIVDLAQLLTMTMSGFTQTKLLPSTTVGNYYETTDDGFVDVSKTTLVSEKLTTPLTNMIDEGGPTVTLPGFQTVTMIDPLVMIQLNKEMQEMSTPPQSSFSLTDGTTKFKRSTTVRDNSTPGMITFTTEDVVTTTSDDSFTTKTVSDSDVAESLVNTDTVNKPFTVTETASDLSESTPDGTGITSTQNSVSTTNEMPGNNGNHVTSISETTNGSEFVSSPPLTVSVNNFTDLNGVSSANTSTGATQSTESENSPISSVESVAVSTTDKSAQMTIDPDAIVFPDQSSRKPRSLHGYSPRTKLANWVVPSHGAGWYRNPVEQWFWTYSGDKLVPVLTYTAYLPFARVPSIGATALQLPLDDPRYSLLILLPNNNRGLKNLLYTLQWCPIRSIIYSLKHTPLYAIIPAFTISKQINLIPALMKLGIRDVFDPYHSNLSEMSSEPNLYVRNIQQVVSISVRKYFYTNRWFESSPSQIDQHFLAMHPFAFFVIDEETKVTLIAGTIVDPTH